MFNSYFKNMLLIILTIVLSTGATFGQASGFTYQGRLTDGGVPANGNYDLQVALFDAATGTNQIGLTNIFAGIPVSAGVFTVTLDFGANAFSGGNRFLEISARPGGTAVFTLLTPRQPITSTPYAVNAQQLAGVDAGQYVKTNDARLSDARDPKAGSPSYLQNSVNQQAASNFNISGNGTAGGVLSANVVNANSNYNVGGLSVMNVRNNTLSLGGPLNVGIGTDANSKLAVAGTVESTTGGFKFPDGSVQTNAVGKVITTGVGLPEMEIGAFSNDTTINTLSLPRGTYLVTATVSFQNRASDVFANNTRLVLCQLANDLLWYNRLGAKNDSMDRITVTMHSVRTHTATASVSLTCRAIDGGQVFVTARRLTAVRVGDNPETQ